MLDNIRIEKIILATIWDTKIFRGSVQAAIFAVFGKNPNFRPNLGRKKFSIGSTSTKS